MTKKQIINLPIQAGQYTEQTERGAQGQWYSMDRVRFRKGLAEKLGGWVQLAPQFLGIARRLKDWASLDSKRWAAIGTDTKLYLWQNSNLYDITPVRRTVTLSAPFQTFTGEQRVRVTDVNHGAQSGDYVRFSNAIVGPSSGILVDGEYQIGVIVDTDTYEIIDDQTAVTGAAGEGGLNVEAEYDISAGAATVRTATGYGTSGYGREGYGSPRTGSTQLIGIRTWSLDTWGEDLLASPRGGAIYWWDRTKGTGSRAVALGGDAPPTAEYMLVSQRDRHVLALGAYDYFNQAIDPLLIRWCSTEDLNDWVPTSTNTSGDLRLYSGSKIVTGVRSRLETVIFTDVSVHTLPFVGGFSVFGLNIVGENVSILGPNCAVPVDHRVFFMAEADFYVYDGVVKVVPCSVRNFVYENLNTVQRDKVYGGLNREFNEVWWFYPSYAPNAWVQDDFSLGIPPGYSLANSSSGGTVILQSAFEGTDGDKTVVEESSNAATITFAAPSSSQIDNTRAQFGTTSGTAGLFESRATVPHIAAYELASKDWTIEVGFNLRQLPTNNGTDEWTIINKWHSTNGQAFAVNFIRTVGNVFTMRIRLGATTLDFPITGTTVTGSASAPGTWFHVVVERQGNNINVGMNGAREGSAQTFSGAIPASTQDLAMFGSFQESWDTAMWLDDIRITTDVVVYDLLNNATYTQPIAAHPAPGAGGGAGEIGYSYIFNSAGFTEPTSTAQNGYEYDYFLTNDEPLITPAVAEYGVEFAFNPDGNGAASRWAGLVFLREDIQGNPNTTSDDAQGIYIEADIFTDTIRVRKKDAAGVKSAMDNDPGTTTFNAVLGSPAATDQKYIFIVQLDENGQITLWLDSVQVFQFNLSAAEQALYTSGSTGLHVDGSADADDEFKFYNFAAGPVGVLTDPDFDISPVEVNRYVALNYEEGTWITGKLARTAWSDRSPLLEKPYAASADGYLYQHETGTDDNGAAMEAFIESYDMEIPGAGEELMHVDQLIPDFLELEGSVTVNLTGRKYPQDPNRISKGPYTVAPGTRKLSTRIRARQVAIRVSSSNTGDKWRMGVWRGRAGAHGKRG